MVLYLESGVILMCTVRLGMNIQSTADLQNLITSIILREKSLFTLDDVVSETKKNVLDSMFQESDDKIKEMCQDTITKLALFDCIQSVDGNSFKLSISFPSTANA